ncbi:hypothetical protein ACFVDI_21250 [Nocardioides sp. NPDC057767]|uniref:hypothetical protein n=1 Tax=unclassified Nocardioides TaxID=2615069 RepID=UPI003671F953
MRFRALLRSSAALPILPIAIAAAAFYYIVNGRDQVLYVPIASAPLLVAAPIATVYPVAYGLAAATGAWQGSRLRHDGVWLIAPLRQPATVIATTLLPVVATAWLMFLVPVVAAFVERPTMPTWDSLPPLFLGLVLSAAWAIIGFTLGQRVNPIIAAPVLACTVFYVVAVTIAVDPMFVRHMSGYYLDGPGFGESATVESMVAQGLPTVGLVTAVALLWSRLPKLVTLVTGGTLILASTYTSYSIVNDWSYNPTLNAGNVPLKCAGDRPKVCIPKQASGDLDEIRRTVDSAYDVLTAYGVTTTMPDTVIERSIYGRFDPPAIGGTRYAFLLQGQKSGSAAGPLLIEEVRFGCDADDHLAYRVAQLWLGEKLGITRTFESYAGEDPYYTRKQHSDLMKTVKTVSTKPDRVQRAWYQKIKKTACEDAA